jgi:hypothetical protein
MVNGLGRAPSSASSRLKAFVMHNVVSARSIRSVESPYVEAFLDLPPNLRLTRDRLIGLVEESFAIGVADLRTELTHACLMNLAMDEWTNRESIQFFGFWLFYMLNGTPTASILLLKEADFDSQTGPHIADEVEALLDKFGITTLESIVSDLERVQGDGLPVESSTR